MEKKETDVCNAHSWGHFTFGNTCPLSQVKLLSVTHPPNTLEKKQARFFQSRINKGNNIQASPVDKYYQHLVQHRQ